MKIISFIVADNVSIDEATKKINISGIFDRVSSERFPAVLNELYVFTCFEGKNKNYRYEITIIYNSKILSKNNDTIKKTGDPYHNIITKLTNIPLPEAGEYVIKVTVDNQIAERKFNVVKINK